jgi:hypothetical protein
MLLIMYNPYMSLNLSLKPTIILISSSPIKWPNVAVKWLAPHLRIQEVTGSNLGPDTRYLEENLLQICPTRKMPFQQYVKFGHSLFINHPIIQRYVIYVF